MIALIAIPGACGPALTPVPQPTSSVMPQARRLVADLFEPRPAIYWTDFLGSLTVGYTATAIYLSAIPFSPAFFLAWLIAGVVLFRVSLFMHEIVHFRRGEMTAFKACWNVLVGIPFLMPTFLYEHHLNHHNANHYGTPDDGEYLPLGIGRLRTTMLYLLQIAFLPVLVTLRFLVGTPVSFLHPKLRQAVLERYSPLVINFRHRREIPADAPRWLWALIEITCFLRVLGLFAFLVVAEIQFGGHSVALGWERVAKLYLLATLALGLNHVRTLCAHRYRSEGGRLSFAEQLDDSLNIEGCTPLIAMLFPVGLRYHALHHLFPSIPYHNLGIAHRRIIQHLPEWEAYRAATYPTFAAALRELRCGMREACAAPPPGADRWFARRSGIQSDVVRPPRDAQVAA
jgi:fatty acid desaturase